MPAISPAAIIASTMKMRGGSSPGPPPEEPPPGRCRLCARVEDDSDLFPCLVCHRDPHPPEPVSDWWWALALLVSLALGPGCWFLTR